MKNYLNLIKTFTVLCAVIVLFSNPTNAGSGAALGPTIILNSGTDDLSFGASLETKSFVSTARLAPSIDFSLGDQSITTLNMDLRWYLLPLPNTGIKFYGSAGPTLLFANNESDLGLTLSAGMKIPANNKKKYMVEVRFGFGDLPDTKISFALLFPI